MSIPPTYYFNNIDFNTYYFTTLTSSASFASLKPYFLNKFIGDTATGTKTITSGARCSNPLNMVKTQFAFPQINFKSNTGTLRGILTCDISTLILDTQTLGNGFRILSNGNVLYNISPTLFEIPGTYAYSFSSSPLYTVSQIGFNYGTNTPSYTGNKTAVGTYLAYNSTNAVALPIGVYKIMINATLAGVSSANLSVFPFIVGYTLGTNSTASLNTANPIWTSPRSYTFSANYNFSVNCVDIVTITVDNSYLSAYSSTRISAYIIGSLQSGISSYSVIRIG